MNEPFKTPAMRDLEEWVAATRAGRKPSLSLVTRHAGGDILGACLEKIIELTAPPPVTDNAPTAGDFRRAAALACAAATEDQAAVNVLICEAAEAGRFRTTLIASSLSVAQGMRADTPDGLQQLRDYVAQLAALEDEENN